MEQLQTIETLHQKVQEETRLTVAAAVAAQLQAMEDRLDEFKRNQAEASSKYVDGQRSELAAQAELYHTQLDNVASHTELGKLRHAGGGALRPMGHQELATRLLHGQRPSVGRLVGPRNAATAAIRAYWQYSQECRHSRAFRRPHQEHAFRRDPKLAAPKECACLKYAPDRCGRTKMARLLCDIRISRRRSGTKCPSTSNRRISSAKGSTTPTG